MSKRVSLTLDEHFAGFIAGQVADGRYGSPSAVVLAGLQLLEDQETRLSTLRAALIEGEESGPATPLDFDAFVAGMHGSGPAA